MIPAAQKALIDKRIRGTPREVYFWLHERLETAIYRPTTLGRIVIGTGMHRATVHVAVKRLLEVGYIDRRFGDSRMPLYRLVNALDE